MLGESINDDFLAKTIIMRKVWKEEKKRNPRKATCLGRTSVVSKVISGGVRRLVQI